MIQIGKTFQNSRVCGLNYSVNNLFRLVGRSFSWWVASDRVVSGSAPGWLAVASPRWLTEAGSGGADLRSEAVLVVATPEPQLTSDR